MAIRWASGLGYVEFVKELLLDSKVNPAANYNNDPVKLEALAVNISLYGTADPSFDCAIFIASSKGNLNVVKILLQHQKVRVSSLQRAIDEASRNEYLEVVKVLNDKLQKIKATGSLNQMTS